MKRILSVLLIVVLTVSLCGCKDTYEEDKAAVMLKMNQLAADTTILGNEILKIGNVTGATDLFIYLNKVLSVDDFQDYLDEIQNDGGRKRWEEYTDELFGTFLQEASHMNLTAHTTQQEYAVEEFIAYGKEYNEKYNNVQTSYDSLPAEIKEFKEKHKDKHSEGVELIVEYYLVCSEYAENITSPSCTLPEYGEMLSAYPEKLEQLQKKIDLA